MACQFPLRRSFVARGIAMPLDPGMVAVAEVIASGMS
jgi:hypothetical protein